MRVRGATIDYWVSKQLEDRLRGLDEFAAQQLLLRRIEQPPIRPSFAIVRRFLVLAGKFLRRTVRSASVPSMAASPTTRPALSILLKCWRDRANKETRMTEANYVQESHLGRGVVVLDLSRPRSGSGGGLLTLKRR